MPEFNIKRYLKQLENSSDADHCEKVPLPEIKRNQNYFIISYCHVDYKKVYADLAHLYIDGYRFWYDKGLPAGENWDKEMSQRIKKCAGVIFYTSTNSFSSPAVRKEINFARQYHKVSTQYKAVLF